MITVLHHLFFVSGFEVTVQNQVSVMPDRDHTGCLAHRSDVSVTDFIWSGNEIFEINVIRQVHLSCAGGFVEIEKIAKNFQVEKYGFFDPETDLKFLF